MIGAAGLPDTLGASKSTRRSDCMPLDRTFERRLSGLVNHRAAAALHGGLKGLEKESLRVSPRGRIAATPHPRALGSALTNEHITTDYSEALLELVTPAFPQTWELTQYLCDLHQFVYRHLGDELLWATSMPWASCSIDTASGFSESFASGSEPRCGGSWTARTSCRRPTARP